MRLSRNVKQNGTTAIVAILTLVAHFFLYYGGEEFEFADTIELSLPASLVDLLDETGRNIVPVEMKADTTLRNSNKLHLLGGLDFDAKIGDILVFRKEDDHWTEVVGRYLAE